MAEIIIEVSDEVKQKLQEFPEIDWSKVIAEYISREAYKLFRLKSITSKSKLTEEDAIRLGREINKSLHQKYKNLYPKLK